MPNYINFVKELQQQQEILKGWEGVGLGLVYYQIRTVLRGQYRGNISNVTLDHDRIKS